MTGHLYVQRRTPLLGDDPDYSLAVYPDPPSHDFLVWLVIAELMRCHHGAPAPLKVTFAMIDGQLGKFDWGPLGLRLGRASPCGVSREYSDTMLANVLRPAIEMIGAVEEPTIHAPFQIADLAHHVEFDYHIGHLVDSAKQGYKVPKFTTPQWARDEVKRYLGDQKPIVITLREAPAQPERNSRLDDWLRFAETIQGDHPILFVRDTAKAEDKVSPFPTWGRPAQNAYVRAALYEAAYVNMAVCNGPIGWMMFTDAPYLIFKQLNPLLPDWEHGSPQGWMNQAHLLVGEQYPWASPRQRLTWTDDTFDNIRSAFDDFR